MSRSQKYFLAFLISLVSSIAIAAPGGPQAVIYYSDGVKALKDKLYLSDGTVFSAAQKATEAPGISNCSLAASVGSSALTIALKDGAGSDPSSASPCVIAYRNATATTGTVTKSTVSAALSVVVSNGSALGCTASSVCTLYVYGIYTGSATVLGVINGGMLYEGVVASSTAEGGSGGADTIDTLYSTAAQTSKPVKYLGRVTVTPAASFAWSNAPTAIVSGDYPVAKAPTVQRLTSGSGTYTLPTSPKPLYIRVFAIGAGGQGGGSGTASGSAGTAGTATTWKDSGDVTTYISAGGGSGGGIAGTGGGAGGTNSTSGVTVIFSNVGGKGGGYAYNSSATGVQLPGGAGGNSYLGGAGQGDGAAAGSAAAANTGSGGAGGGSAWNVAAIYTGGGGGAGGVVYAEITAPLATYNYVVGAGGDAAGAAGTSGYAGGNGAAGLIVVEEFYQ